jgi:hypothetical protein
MSEMLHWSYQVTTMLSTKVRRSSRLGTWTGWECLAHWSWLEMFLKVPKSCREPMKHLRTRTMHPRTWEMQRLMKTSLPMSQVVQKMMPDR